MNIVDGKFYCAFCKRPEREKCNCQIAIDVYNLKMEGLFLGKRKVWTFHIPDTNMGIKILYRRDQTLFRIVVYDWETKSTIMKKNF